DRKFFRSAQHRMFENVRQAGGILRRCGKGDAEHLVLVVIDERKHLRPGLFVPVMARQRADLGDLFFGNEVIGGMIGHGGFPLWRDVSVTLKWRSWSCQGTAAQ